MQKKKQLLSDFLRPVLHGHPHCPGYLHTANQTKPWHKNYSPVAFMSPDTKIFGKISANCNRQEA